MSPVANDGPGRLVPAGTIGSPHGIEGALRLWSETSPPEAIFDYGPWTLAKGELRRTVRVVGHGRSGGRLIVRLDLAATPEEARLWTGATVLVPRASFPPAPPGQYYFVDLLGLAVCDEDGCLRGTVEEVTEAPAQPLLRIRDGNRHHIVPFVREAIVLEVDLAAGIVRVRRSALEAS